MRVLVFSLALIALARAAAGFEIEAQVRFGPETAGQRLQVISTADIDFFSPFIAGFLAATEDTAVDYIVVSSSEIVTAIRDENQAFDVAISSAMDLQTKLANDGYARAHSSSATGALPAWGRWRDHVFVFTQEPATIVLSHAAFEGLDLPRTRQDLIALLRQHPDRFRGRVGTYDLRQSGAGYLFATQDARTSETYWRLTEVMGGLDARLYCCSSDMIRDVASGRLAVAYNVLSSYARTRPEAEHYEILMPADFTTVMMRSLLIPDTSVNPKLAGEFVDYVLRAAWARDDPAADRFSIDREVRSADADSLRRIRLGPGLLVYLDTFKKRRFLDAWENAILQR